MSRLPVIAGDLGGWGSILNDFLGVSLNSDGTLKSPLSVSGAGAITAKTLTLTPVSTSAVMATFGGAANLGYQVTVGGQWAPLNAGQSAAFLVASGITAATSQSASLAIVSSTSGITKAGAGTHLLFAGMWVDDLVVNAGAATLTNAASLYVANRPTVGSAVNLYPVWIGGAGGTRIDSDGTDFEVSLNRTAAGNAAQIRLSRSQVAKAYLGLTAADDFQILDSGLVQRLILYNAGALGVGTAPANTGAGTVNVSGGYYSNGTSGITKVNVSSTFTNMVITNGIITSITT